MSAAPLCRCGLTAEHHVLESDGISASIRYGRFEGDGLRLACFHYVPADCRPTVSALPQEGRKMARRIAS